MVNHDEISAWEPTGASCANFEAKAKAESIYKLSVVSLRIKPAKSLPVAAFSQLCREIKKRNISQLDNSWLY